MCDAKDRFESKSDLRSVSFVWDTNLLRLLKYNLRSVPLIRKRGKMRK